MGGAEEAGTGLEGGASEAVSEPAGLQRKEKVGRSLEREGPVLERNFYIGVPGYHGEHANTVPSWYASLCGCLCLEESAKLALASQGTL